MYVPTNKFPNERSQRNEPTGMGPASSVARCIIFSCTFQSFGPSPFLCRPVLGDRRTKANYCKSFMSKPIRSSLPLVLTPAPDAVLLELARPAVRSMTSLPPIHSQLAPPMFLPSITSSPLSPETSPRYAHRDADCRPAETLQEMYEMGTIILGIEVSSQLVLPTSLPYSTSSPRSPESSPRYAHRDTCVRDDCRPTRTPQEMHEMDMMILSSDIFRPIGRGRKTSRRKHSPVVVSHVPGLDAPTMDRGPSLAASMCRGTCVCDNCSPTKTPQEMYEMDMLLLCSDIVCPSGRGRKAFRRKYSPAVVHS